jgi:hypothetical protein
MRTRVSLDRIAHFLRDGEELDDHPRQSTDGEEIRIQGQFRWREASPSQAFTLNVEESVQFPRGKMTVIAGGSKGSLARAIWNSFRFRQARSGPGRARCYTVYWENFILSAALSAFRGAPGRPLRLRFGVGPHHPPAVVVES